MNPAVEVALSNLKKIDPKEAERCEAFYKAGVADGMTMAEVPEGLQDTYENERWAL